MLMKMSIWVSVSGKLKSKILQQKKKNHLPIFAPTVPLAFVSKILLNICGGLTWKEKKKHTEKKERTIYDFSFAFIDCLCQIEFPLSILFAISFSFWNFG